MKKLSLSLFLIVGVFFATNLLSQIVYDCPDIPANFGDSCDDGNASTTNDVVDANCECVGTPTLYVANDDFITINASDPLSFNVFDNDTYQIQNDDFELTIISSQEDNCFYIDNEGYVHYTGDPNSCCGTHILSYYACLGAPGENTWVGCDEATVTIVVNCGIPDCTLINLMDFFQDEDNDGVPDNDNPDASSTSSNECASVCEFSNTTFYVPYNTNNTYTWTVISNGGSWTAGTNDAEIIVTWGATGTGNVSVQINQHPPISLCVDIMLGPTAIFTSSGNSGLNTNIYFTNQSANADKYLWDFGDGNVSTDTDPTHPYTTPGIKTVTLYATKLNYDEYGNQLCSCTDSTSVEVVVDSLPGPNIYCISTLCQGDSSIYWTDATNCSIYNWSVTNTNGDIVPFTGQGNDTISVLWSTGFDGIITLGVGGCTNAYSTSPTTVIVPVIPSVSQITGLTDVCLYSTHVYSLPKWISANYTWTVLDANQNQVPFTGQGEHQISINWNMEGVSHIHVEYTSNFLNGTADHTGTECTGVADLAVTVKPRFEIGAPEKVVCAGSTSYVFATSSPSSDYFWTVSPPATITSGQGTAMVTITWGGGPGTYTVSAMPNDPTVYCNTIQTQTIRVVELPPPLSIDGPQSICADEAVLYTVNSSETGVGYMWTVNAGTPAYTSTNSKLITWGAGAGSLSVYQFLPDIPHCVSTPISLNVSEKSVAGPLNITGTAACTNSISTYTLSPAQIADAKITWSIDATTNGSILSGQGTEAIQVQWNNDSGPVFVKVDVEVCGNVESFTLSETLYSPIKPVITQNGTLCPGVTADLVTGTGFISYLWSTSSNNTTHTTQISAGGNYSVTTVDVKGCSATTYFKATELPGPVANISSGDNPHLCVNGGGTVNMVAENNLNYSITWFLDGHTPSVGTGSSHLHTNTNVVQNFKYYFEIVDANGCTSKSPFFNVSQDSCPHNPGPLCPVDPYAISILATDANPACDEYTFTTPTLSNASVSFWTFGDGTISTASPATHKYSKAGCYHIYMGALVPTNDGSGGFCSVKRDTSICVPVAADFSFEYVGCDSVHFTDQSTFIDNANPIVSWEWSFTTGQNPSQTFSNIQNAGYKFGPGTHSVTLEVTTGDGCKATVTKNIEIESVSLNSMTASSIPYPPCMGDSIAFSSLAPGAVEWLWDFGDGATFFGENPFHSYISAGTYSVDLTVTDENGCTDSGSLSVVANPGIPDNLAIVPGDTTICTGTSLTYTAPAGVGYTYLWSTGETTQSITVSAAGKYDVIITNSNGCSKQLDASTLSLFPAPVATISGNPVICDGGYTNLIAQSSSGMTSLFWTNGSGPAGIYSPLTVYSNNINNPYTVTVTDENGCSDTSDPINVVVATSPNFVIDVSPDPCEGKPITLTVNPYDPNVNYNWTTGQTGQSIQVLEAGVYTVIGTNNDFGCSYSSSVTVHPIPNLSLVPVGCYEMCPDTICGPVGLASYQWLFNGAPIAGIPGMEHCVAATVSGKYQLAATNSFGCTTTSDTLRLTILNCDSATCEKIIVSANPLNTSDGLSGTVSDGLTDNCCSSLSYSGNLFDLVGMKIHSTDAEMLFDMGSIDPQLQAAGSGTSSLFLASINNGDPIPSAVSDFVNFCFGEVLTSPQTVIIDWYDMEAMVVCSDTLIFHCPVEPDCTYLLSDSIYCEGTDQVMYDITVCNPHNAAFAVGYIDIDVITPSGILVTPSNIPIGSPILPGTCRTFTMALSGNYVAGGTFCYNIQTHESDPELNPTGLCCALDTIYCVDIPVCNPCDLVGFESSCQVPGEPCCYTIHLYNDYDDDFFDEIALSTLSSTTTLNVENPFNSGWFTQNLTNTSVSFIPADGSLDMGFIKLPKICVSSELGPNHLVEIKWLKDGEIYCRDTISLFCEPQCGYVFDDNIVCGENNMWEFSASLKNMSDNAIDFVKITFDDYDINAISGYSFHTGGTPSLGIYTGINFAISHNLAMPGDTICFTLSLHDQAEQGNHVSCCNIRYCIVLPACDFDLPCICEPEFYEHVHNGITFTQYQSNPNQYTFQLADHSYFQNCDLVIWRFGDGTNESIDGGAPITHLYTSGPPAWVCVEVYRIDDNGNKCAEKTCLSFEKHLASQFLIYPNPSNGMFNILSKTGINEDLLVEIRDINNRPVFREQVINEYSDREIEVDIANLSSGLYFVHFITSENHWVEKISKQ